MDEERWKKVKGTYPEEWPLDALDIEDEEKKKKLKELKTAQSRSTQEFQYSCERRWAFLCQNGFVSVSRMS